MQTPKQAQISALRHTVRPKFTIGELRSILQYLPETNTLHARIALMVAKAELEYSLGIRKASKQPPVSGVRENPIDFAKLDDSPALAPVSREFPYRVTMPLIIQGVPDALQDQIFTLLTSPDSIEALDSLLKMNGYTRESLGLPSKEKQKILYLAFELRDPPYSVEEFWEEVFPTTKREKDLDKSKNQGE